MNAQTMMISGSDLNSLKDGTLCQLVNKSNRDALIAIYDRYSPKLYIYILKIVSMHSHGTRLEDETKEILIRVFDSLWEGRDLLSDSTRLEDFLFALACQHAMHFIGPYKSVS